MRCCAKRKDGPEGGDSASGFFSPVELGQIRDKVLGSHDGTCSPDDKEGPLQVNVLKAKELGNICVCGWAGIINGTLVG